MKKILLILALLLTVTHAKENYLSIEKFNKIQKEKIDACMKTITASIFNFEKTEKYYICKKENYKVIEVRDYKIGNKYLTISSEIFLVENKKLLYAKESEGFIKIDPKKRKEIKYTSWLAPYSFYQKDLTSWNCEYQISRHEKKVINYISLGTGKTEDPMFNPNDIFKLYDNIIKELKRIKEIM